MTDKYENDTLEDRKNDMAEEADLAETAPLIVCDSLVKIYKTKEVEVLALQGLDLTVNRGELMAIIGKSGSGKSTLMNIVGGLEVPSAGRIIVDGQNLAEFTERQMVQYRKKQIGFVWQKSGRNLFPYLTSLENIEAPMLAIHKSAKKRREKAEELLALVGMEHKRDSYPARRREFPAARHVDADHPVQLVIPCASEANDLAARAASQNENGSSHFETVSRQARKRRILAVRQIA